jgi:hypothetical protein
LGDWFRPLAPPTVVMAAQMRCWLLALFLAGLCGCGGKANSADGPPGGAAAAQGGSAQGGSAQGGSGGSAGAPAGGTANEMEGPSYDDVFPWFDGGGNSEIPNGQNDEILHLVATGTPGHATLSTHNHSALLSDSLAIEFAARASAPTRLLVSASNAIQEYDYFAARDQGKQWPVVPVEVGLDWQHYHVPISDMKPAEMGDADGIPSFWLAFIVEHSEPVEVWLDQVRFVPKR